MLIAGIMIGVAIGGLAMLFILGLCMCAKRGDEMSELPEDREFTEPKVVKFPPVKD